MPLTIADRVRETTITSGTGPITLAGPYSGFQAFSVIGNGNTTYYVIIDALNIAWEVGIGTYTSASNTLTRTTVLASSNAGSLVNLGVGTKDVILTQPAGRSVLVQEGGSGLIAGTTAFTANAIPYANSSSTLTTGSALTFDGATLINTAGPVSAAGFTALASGGEGGQIGLQNPTNTGDVAALDVLDATTARLFTQVNNAALLIGQLSGTGGTTRFFTAASERMRIDSAGNVGIGTSSPTYRLDNTGVSRLGSAVTAVAPSATDILSTAHTILGGSGGNSLTFGQYPVAQNFAQWIQSSFANPTIGTYNLVLQPLGGNVGIGTSSPNASAILDVQSTTKGVRMPNMTTTQKNAIASPAAGLMVFDTTLAKLCVYTGAAWETITST